MIKVMRGRVMGMQPYSFKDKEGRDVLGKRVYVDIPLGDAGQGSMAAVCSAGARYLVQNPLDVGDEIVVGRDGQGKYQIIDAE